MINSNYGFPILLLFSSTGFLVSALIVFDSSRPDYYTFLFWVPLFFAITSLFFNRLYSKIPKNLGVTFVLFIYYCRYVLAPASMSLGDYQSRIEKNISLNTFPATLLMCYEIVIVFLALYIYISKTKGTSRYDYLNPIEGNYNIRKSYLAAVLVLLVIDAICFYLTPEIKDVYRTIFGITQTNYANYEQAYIVQNYGNTFIKKLSLVTGLYITKIIILLLPATGIIFSRTINNRQFANLFSLLLCFVPFLFVDGAIARSLIFVVTLLMLRKLALPPSDEKSNLTISIILVAAFSFVIYYWIVRYRVNGNNMDLMEYFSIKFNSYFSSVNTISGAFNLPTDLEYRLRYFAYDILGTIPYGNTVFHLTHVSSQTFYNTWNSSLGQIPPTIGMGYYYFGSLLSPIYSIIYSIVACYCSNKILITKDLLAKVRLLISIFYFSMGTGMYNIDITNTTFFSVIIPLYLLELFNKSNVKSQG